MGKRTRKKSQSTRELIHEILEQHFEAHPVTILRAWEFVYRELLWSDGRTGEAHLYESDKVQPGRSAWHQRAVRFTDRLCHEFGNVTRAELRAQIDALFRECLRRDIKSQADEAERSTISRAIAGDPNEGLPPDIVKEAKKVAASTPEYVPDEELVAEFAQILEQTTKLPKARSLAMARELVSKARYYFTVGNKRQNYLGPGFECVLELLLTKLTSILADRLHLQKKVNLLPGFAKQANRDRIETPDLAIVAGGETKLLASVKWSLRHDRQKQLGDELACYVDLRSQKKFPQCVLITNEFDLGRLVNVNQLKRGTQQLSCIYHVQRDFLLEALSDSKEFKSKLDRMVQAGRLRSPADFLTDVNREFGTGAALQPLTPDQKRQQRKRSR